MINFGTQVQLRSLTVEGFVPTLEFGDLIFKLLWMNATLLPPMRRCNNLCNSALFVLWYYDVWMWYSTRNLGNMICNGLIALQLCGFSFAKIRSFHKLVVEDKATETGYIMLLHTNLYWQNASACFINITKIRCTTHSYVRLSYLLMASILISLFRNNKCILIREKSTH